MWWKEDCFYCGDLCVDEYDGRHSTRYSATIRMATSLNFKENLMKVCAERDDVWANEVKLRIVNCHDFRAVKARYHDYCRNRFNATTVQSLKGNSFSLNSTFLEESRPCGRPLDYEKLRQFKELCTWLDSQTEILSLSEVHDKLMSQNCQKVL